MPSTEELIQILHKVPLFSRLERPQLRRLVLVVKEVPYPPGQVVCAQGEPGTRYYIILSGAVRVTRVDPEGRVLEVKRLGPGDVFGETSLLLGDVRDATVETLEETVFLCIDKEDFDRLLSAHPEIERALKTRPDVAEQRRYLRRRFSWLEPGELVVKMVRRHPFTLWERIGVTSLFALLLIVGGIRLLALSSPLGELIGALLLLATLPLLLVIGYFFWDWRNDIYVLTNRRVIHRERPGIMGERFSAAPLWMIQNVQIVQASPLEQLLNYGDLLIETAGAAGQVVFRQIARPYEVQQAILVQQERVLSLARVQERESIRKAVRHHFLKEEPSVESPALSGPAPGRRGCLPWILSVWRYFFPSSWHREGLTVTWRRHWTAMLEAVWLPFVVGTGLTGGMLLLEYLMQGKVPYTVVLVYAAAMFCIIPWFLWRFEDYRNDYFQVTATRVIQVNRLPFLLREERREAALEQVTNVRFEQGVVGRILKYGDVFVETAAPAGTFHFQRVARPQEVQREIFAHIEAARRRRQEEEARQRRLEMLEWLSAYDELRRSPQSGSSEEKGS